MKLRSIPMCLMLVSGACLAHGELPDSRWCEGGRMTVVATIVLHGPALADQRTQCLASSASGAPRRECGQFDDDYGFVREKALAQCNASGPGHRGGGSISVIFVPDAPASFLSPEHHAEYSAGEGVSGSCVRCDSMVAQPLQPSY